MARTAQEMAADRVRLETVIQAMLMANTGNWTREEKVKHEAALIESQRGLHQVEAEIRAYIEGGAPSAAKPAGRGVVRADAEVVRRENGDDAFRKEGGGRGQ